MVEEYSKFEQECVRIRQENAELMELFLEDLQGLTPKTIERHCLNVNFYINDFLLHMEANDFTCGISMINEFLGDYFIRKCMWSTPATIKSTTASIKKFYKSMLKHGKIQKAEYDSLCETIKEFVEVWQEECEQYNSGVDDSWMIL